MPVLMFVNWTKFSALVFTHDTSLNSSMSSSPSTATATNVASNATTKVASPHSAPSSSSVATQHNALNSPNLCKNKSGSVHFTDFHFDHPANFNEPGYADDNISISSRGTSSTVGYRWRIRHKNWTAFEQIFWPHSSFKELLNFPATYDSALQKAQPPPSQWVVSVKTVN